MGGYNPGRKDAIAKSLKIVNLLESPGGTIDDSLVWPVQPALLDHLILVLDEKLNTLDGSGNSLKKKG